MLTEQELDRLAQEQATLIFREDPSRAVIDQLMRAFKRGYYAHSRLHMQQADYGGYTVADLQTSPG